MVLCCLINWLINRLIHLRVASNVMPITHAPETGARNRSVCHWHNEGHGRRRYLASSCRVRLSRPSRGTWGSTFRRWRYSVPWSSPRYDASTRCRRTSSPHSRTLRMRSARNARRSRQRNKCYNLLNGNSTPKHISPKINIYDKWSYVSVIKLTKPYKIGWQ